MKILNAKAIFHGITTVVAGLLFVVPAGAQSQSKQAALAHVEKLKKGLVKPNDCMEMMNATGDEQGITYNTMRVTLGKNVGRIGFFNARVSKIKGISLFTVDEGDGNRVGIVGTDNAKVFNVDNITPGTYVFGYGEFIGTHDVELTNGSMVSAAVVDAKCVEVSSHGNMISAAIAASKM